MGYISVLIREMPRNDIARTHVRHPGAWCPCCVYTRAYVYILTGEKQAAVPSDGRLHKASELRLALASLTSRPCASLM